MNNKTEFLCNSFCHRWTLGLCSSNPPGSTGWEVQEEDSLGLVCCGFWGGQYQ